MKGLPFSLKFLPPRSAAEEVSKYLQKAIIHGKLKPGSRLIERNLSEALGVSRIPIREAFRMLEVAGLVKIIPRKGAQVTAFTNKEIDEIYTLRSDLVSLAARLAAAKRDDGLLKRMEKVCKRMDEKARRGDLEGYFPLLTEFHNLLYQASGNRRLHQILEVLARQTTRYRYASLGFPGRVEQSNAHHQELMEALKKKDAATAARITRKSIDEGRKLLLKHLATHPERFGLPPADPSPKAAAWRTKTKEPNINENN